MSASRVALDALVEALAAAIAPAPVVVDDGRPVSDVGAVQVTPLSLDRVGRSRRHGALVDLELAVAVTATGPEALDHIERLIVEVEHGPHPGTALPASSSPGRLGFVVRVPVTVPVDEPSAPLVTVPPVLQVHLVRGVDGVLLDEAGQGISGATLTSAGAVSVTGANGVFRLLVAEGAPTVSVAHGGERRDLPLDPQNEPAHLLWAGPPG